MRQSSSPFEIVSCMWTRKVGLRLVRRIASAPMVMWRSRQVRSKALPALLALFLCMSCGGDSPLTPSPPTPPQPPVVVDPPPSMAVVGTSFYRDGHPFLWAGVTAFDLPARIAEGDRAFLDWAADTGFTVVRIVPASFFRTPRTLDDGVRQIGPALDAIASRGLVAEVVVGVDTHMYGLSAAQFAAYAAQIAEVVNKYPHVVVEVANENTHHLQGAYLRDWAFQQQIIALFKAPTSAGSTHGGEQPLWNGGAYVTHHGARDRTPEQNAAEMAAAQARFRLPVVDDEALGISMFARPGSRTNDALYGVRQAEAAKRYKLGGVTLHLEAGLTARVGDLDEVQREAARRFIAAMR